VKDHLAAAKRDLEAAAEAVADRARRPACGRMAAYLADLNAALAAFDRAHAAWLGAVDAERLMPPAAVDVQTSAMEGGGGSG